MSSRFFATSSSSGHPAANSRPSVRIAAAVSGSPRNLPYSGRQPGARRPETASTALSPDQLGNPAHSRRHHRYARLQRLLQHQRPGLPVGGQQEDVSSAEEVRHVVPVAQQPHRQLLRVDPCLQVVPERPVADHGEHHVRAVRRDLGRYGQQSRVVLLRSQPAHCEHQRAPRRSPGPRGRPADDVRSAGIAGAATGARRASVAPRRLRKLHQVAGCSQSQVGATSDQTADRAASPVHGPTERARRCARSPQAAGGANGPAERAMPAR